jgi:hypothetical protein
MEGLVQIFVKHTFEVVQSLYAQIMGYNFAPNNHAKPTASLAYQTVCSHKGTRPTTEWILTKFRSEIVQSYLTLAYWV